jgi:hypothetical protein
MRLTVLGATDGVGVGREIGAQALVRADQVTA